MSSSKLSLLSLPRELQIAILFELDYAGLMVCRQARSLTPSSEHFVIGGMLRYAARYEISWNLPFCNTNASWSTPPWWIVRMQGVVHRYVLDSMPYITKA